jgi:hypothetical protein
VTQDVTVEADLDGYAWTRFAVDVDQSAPDALAAH